MKGKSFFCCALVTVMALCGGLAIGAKGGMTQADALGKISVDFSAFDKSATDFSAIEESSVDDSRIFFPIDRPSIDISGEEEDLLPSNYCLRDDYVLYAQHQDKQGYCWNFAATMAASTTIMRHTNEYYDFSELWNGISCLYTGNNYSKVGSGGHFSYQYDAIKNNGLMLESDLPYQESYIVSNENAADYYNFFSQYANDDLVDCLQSKSFKKTDIESIKKHIYNYGSAYMAFSFRTGYVPDENGITALPPNQTNCNSSHAVAVVGWDDNYEREFYLDGSDTPTLFKGAWIILNSFTETSGTDGLSFVFYDDKNTYDFNGYEYKRNTDKDLYFYDKIEEGYAYPNTVKGKYCGDFTAQEGTTKQKNIFYDDVNLEYSYTLSKGASIKSIEIYLNNVNVTKEFDVAIDSENKRFTITKEDAAYGNYKILVSYANEIKSGTYLNNFYVTYGLIGEKLEFDTESNNLAFNVGRDLEYYSVIVSNKNYAIYTNQLSGNISFLPTSYTSIYSDKNMSIPTLSYNIVDGNSCTVTHTITANSEYELNYNFHVEYYEDTTLQPVTVYYDLGGGVNHPKNYGKELASDTTDLLLYEPTREGYAFKGWCLGSDADGKMARQEGDLYYIDWNDIHHLGESPTLYASSYYKQYYNNSNVLFLFACWEKTDYYNVETELVGNGTVTPSGNTTASRFDTLTYTFTPDEGYKIKDVKIDGVSVGPVMTYTFEGVTCEHTVSVEFEIIKNKIIVNAEGKGSVSNDHPLDEVSYGDSRAFTFVPDEDWCVLCVFVNGERVEITDNQLTVDNVKEDTYVLVVFEEEESNAVFLATVIPISVVAAGSTGTLLYVGVKQRKKRWAKKIIEGSTPSNDGE